MKKLFILFLILILAVSVIGCGGGNKKDDDPILPSSRYIYEWSPSAEVSESSMLSASSFAASDFTASSYSSSIIPPYCALSITDGSAQMMSVITTYNEVTEIVEGDPVIYKNAVVSDFACNAADGSLSVTSGESTVFSPIRLGLLSITATWNGNTLNIPVKIYHFTILNGSLGPETAFDFDNMVASNDNLSPNTDLYFNSYGFQTPYGSEIVSNTYGMPLISSILNAPAGAYSTTNAGNPNFPYDTLIIKTSGGKYVKLIQTSQGTQGRGLVFFVSDNAGVFEY
jgi:hypothetical protein